MVSTRSQNARLVPLNQAIDRMRRARRWVKRYKPSDTSKRHRLADRQPKSQHVVSYNRRT